MSRLTGRVVCVTGASSGIGRASALALAREGAAVALLARRADRLRDVTEAISASGGRALAVPGDVTREPDLQSLVGHAIDTFGRVDVMICNAGIGYHGALDETPPDVMRRLVDVNLLGTLYAARAALPVFRRQGRGHIIAVSSMAGRRGIGGSSVYSATKAAQIACIEALRTEFVGSDLHASVIYPVAVDTEFRAAITRDFGHEIEGHGPSQSVEEVAQLIVDCVVSPRAEVYPSRKAWWFAVLSVVAPEKADRLARRFSRRIVSPETVDGDSTA
jgi:NADP-dependent 3-hydroxy acid dehydrogenase YdfG